MADAGIVAVAKATLKIPLVPMVAGCAVPLMVMETVSPAVGNVVPLPTAPPSDTELVPAKMACDGVRPLNAAAKACTVSEVVPTTFPTAAETVAVPGVRPLARPREEMLATVEGVALHRGFASTCVVLLEFVPVAVN